MKIQRVNNISEEVFINEFVVPNRPVIITGAMKNWQTDKFTPKSLIDIVGDFEVQVYNDLFDLQNISTLREYFEENFENENSEQNEHQYVRAYSQLRDLEFYWADQIFEKLISFWGNPEFFPSNHFAIPYVPANHKVSINNTRFPYRGLFISGKGARTRLHRDPFTSDAVLCQFYGSKEVKLYDPSQENYLVKNGEFFDPSKPDNAKFPDHQKATCSFDDILSPGEIVYFPGGWFHDVRCVSDSISITWNYVHASRLNVFLQYINDHPSDDQLEIVRYFLKDHLTHDASVEDIISNLRQQFSKEELSNK